MSKRMFGSYEIISETWSCPHLRAAELDQAGTITLTVDDTVVQIARDVVPLVLRVCPICAGAAHGFLLALGGGLR